MVSCFHGHNTTIPGVLVSGSHDATPVSPMIPEPFASTYPHLTAALVAMKSQGPGASSSGVAAEAMIGQELSNANKAGESLAGLLVGLFDGPPQPNDEFMRFSLAAYSQLGAGEDVCFFMGRLWADAMEGWTATERTQFLLLMVHDRREAFSTLKFAIELFRRIHLTAEEVFPWIMAARQQVGDHLYHGFWGCIEAFCAKSPAEAVAVAGLWLDSRPERESLEVIANMIGWLRRVTTLQPAAAALFSSLEERLRAAGNAAWRAAYIQSWAGAAGQPLLDERIALDLRDRCLCPDGEEEIAWCFLLSCIAHADRSSWSWTHRELKRVARPSMGDKAKCCTLLTGLNGIAAANHSGPILAEDWCQLLVALFPVSATNVEAWDAIEHTLNVLAVKDASAMREVVKILAQHSGKTWLQVVDDGKFAGFFQLLRQKGLATMVSGDLCFHAEAPARHLGIVVFASAVEKLDPRLVGSASPDQIELLLLEAQRRHIDYGALARLHACLAGRVDEIGGDLLGLFYEEVAMQCLNTYHYRTALAAAIADHEYLAAILTDVRERLGATHQASASPALRMQVPGQARAERLHGQKLMRDVSKGVREQSFFLNQFPTICLLYGGTGYRMFSGGSLGAPSEMRSASSSFEEIGRASCRERV